MDADRDPPTPVIVYTGAPGKPMAGDTPQQRWIAAFYGNLTGLFRDHPDVLVAANLPWHPVAAQPELRKTPHVLVAFGRSKGDRASYRQWEEGNVPVTVAIDVLAPSDTYIDFDDKLAFYEEHGVEEFYVYDPAQNWVGVFLRQGDVLRRRRQAQGHVSSRLGIRFELSGKDLVVYRPDGQRFLTFAELDAAQI